MDEDRWETGEHKSLEEHVLENIDAAAKTSEEPAKAALKTANYVKWVAIFLAFYTAMVAIACTYAIYQVQKANDRVTEYLVDQCDKGNISRASEKNVIDTLIGQELEIAELEGYKPSPEEFAALKAITDAAETAWPQIDCGDVEDGKRIIILPSPEGTP